MGERAIPLLGICASGSGVGKTTLLTRLIPALAAHGLRVAIIKHTHHHFDIDHPGKDSYRIRESGATQVLLSSPRRWALMTELPEAKEPDLAQLIRHINHELTDMILVEGFRHEPIPKIEVFRPSLGRPLWAGEDEHVVAIAADGAVPTALPVLDLNDAEEIAAFVMSRLKLQALSRQPE